MRHIIKNFFKHKRNWWFLGGGAVVLAVIGFVIASRGGTNPSIQMGAVERQDLRETVLATGQVVSGIDLDLSFQGSGIIRSITVKEGATVRKGQLLASLDQSAARASLTTAQGSLAQAQANYDKLLAGASAQNVKTYENSVVSAEQDLTNKYNGALNTLNNAYTAIFNAHSIVVNIHNTYFSAPDQQAIAVLDARNDINKTMQATKAVLDEAMVMPTRANIDKTIVQMKSALNRAFNNVDIVRTQTDQGIYYQRVTATDRASLDSQKTSLNTSASTVATLEFDIASLKVSLQKAQDQLLLVKAPPTPAEINLAKAQILSAQGQVASAQAQINNLIIVAPAGGVITQVNYRVGEQVGSLTPVMVLQDVGDLHAEADVSEANIASLKLNQEIDYTFDALGPDEHFKGSILTINPSSTVISGIVNYKVKGSLENVPKIKPGMTVNMSILIESKPQALAVPSTAILKKNNKSFVRVVDDAKKGTYHEVQVQTGMQADGGLVEIVSGLDEGAQIITYMR